MNKTSLRQLFLVLCVIGLVFAGQAQAALTQNFTGINVFNELIKKAQSGDWQKLPIGELMGKIALALKGTPYKAGTLELSTNDEACSINLSSFDCVTFFESTLDFARMLKSGENTPPAMLRQVAYTRYRDGAVGDYTSRLHYTSDWLQDNERKHVISILSDLPGTQHYKKQIDFMSTHANLYPQLEHNPQLVEKMKKIEHALSEQTFPFVPMDKIAQAEPYLKTGDIVAVRTNVPGLDISHTGLVVRTADGVAHFMDASSKKSAMQVTLEPQRLSETLSALSNSPGVVLARPLEP